MIETIEWLDWSELPRDGLRGGRVYAGEACCEKLLPPVQTAVRVARALRAAGVELTLVTPFASEAGLERVTKLVDALCDVVEPLEVVCNDWGVLDLAASRDGCIPIAGRLLVRQDTDPRWWGAMSADFERPFERVVRHVDGTEALLRHELPSPALVRHLQRCSLDAFELLAGYGVRRIEINNLLQGVDVEVPAGWSVSLHVPDVLVSVARECRGMPGTSGWSCAGGCPPAETWRHESVPVELVVRRNGVYYANPAVPPNAEALHVDRIVVLSPV